MLGESRIHYVTTYVHLLSAGLNLDEWKNLEKAHKSITVLMF